MKSRVLTAIRSGAHLNFLEAESPGKKPQFQTPSSKLKNRPARRLLRDLFWAFGVLRFGTSLELGLWCLPERKKSLPGPTLHAPGGVGDWLRTTGVSRPNQNFPVQGVLCRARASL